MPIEVVLSAQKTSVPELNAFKEDTLEKLNKRHASPSTPGKVLREATLDGLKEYIESGKCKNVIVIAGAGMSTSAGIPDFRTPVTGIYNVIRDKYKFQKPILMFEVETFRRNPIPFYTLFRETMFNPVHVGNSGPTAAHHFVKLLQDKGLLLRHYTQNIDGLDRKAGVSKELLMEAHGFFEECFCTGCRKRYPFDWFKEQIMHFDAPYCTECKDVVRPDVVFFGEDPPPEFFHSVKKDFGKCDLLIIIGTSLTVEPFSSLVDHVPDNCPRVVINREKVGVVDEAAMIKKFEHLMSKDEFEVEGAKLASKLAPVTGLNFDHPSNRDVALTGDCDAVVTQLAASLGWKEDLQNLIDASRSSK